MLRGSQAHAELTTTMFLVKLYEPYNVAAADISCDMI